MRSALVRGRSGATTVAVRAAIGAIATTGLVVAPWLLFPTHFDRGLTAYAVGTLVACLITAYRVFSWVQQPQTMALLRLRPRGSTSSDRAPIATKGVARRAFEYFVLNRFIARRGRMRWLAHWSIMTGTLLACAIVFPLVFGWIWFETPPTAFHAYRVMVFGIHVTTIHVGSLPATVMFHGLSVASVLVTFGAVTALVRRARDPGDRLLQKLFEDLLPLFLLLAIAVTGLMLTASEWWFDGAFYPWLAALHAMIVISTMVWLPFSKLSHVMTRPLKLAFLAYDRHARKVGLVACRRCKKPYATGQQVRDLAATQRALGMSFALRGPPAEDYTQICPSCKRVALGLCQANIARPRRRSTAPPPLKE